MKLTTCLFILLFIASTQTSAQQAQADKQHLLVSCQALAHQTTSVTPRACQYYIEGIIATTHFNDTNNNIHTQDKDRQGSSFSRRAIHTRIGNRLQLNDSSYVNAFCLPEGESMAQVFNVLSKPLQEGTKTTQDLNDKIFYTLKTQYPC